MRLVVAYIFTAARKQAHCIRGCDHVSEAGGVARGWAPSKWETSGRQMSIRRVEPRVPDERYSIQNVGDKWETSGRQMSMTCRTKGPRRALEHPECGRQLGDKWETNKSIWLVLAL